MEENIYGKYEEYLPYIMEGIVKTFNSYNDECYKKTGDKIYEHLTSRIKSHESMREKCVRKGLPVNEKSALYDLKDAIGIRIVCAFIDDIYKIVDYIEQSKDIIIVEKKDYIKHAKPNGYRSYHMILEIVSEFEDVLGNFPGHYFVELQIRTIAMDSWASLEHQLKYKKNIKNQDLIVAELKRCADEMTSCDVSMQTIRDLIRDGD